MVKLATVVATPDTAFATRMRMRRMRKDEEREVAERVDAIENGAADLAWQRSYQMTFAQFGKPASEAREDLDYYMVWNAKGTPAVTLNIGAVHSFMKRQTRRSVVQAIVSCHGEIIAAPRTKISFVLTCDNEDFDRLYELEKWAQANKYPTLRVFKAPEEGKVLLLYVRSNGPTDWYGSETATRHRPVIVFDIP